MLQGCASIFNGSEQDVPVKVPKGTIISNFNGSQIPLHETINNNDSITFLRLRRNREHTLRFTYRDKEALVTMSRSLDGGWIGADLFFYIVPLIIDGGTGAWYSFDGVSVSFYENDSSLPPSVEQYDPYALFKERINIVVLAAMGHMGPTKNAFFPVLFANEFLFGIGYHFTDRLSVIAEWNFVNDVNLLSATTKYTYHHSDLSSYQIQARYTFVDDLYGALGGGISSASVDHIYYYDETDIRHIESGTAQTFPTAFAAIGYSGNTGYVELRHTLGFRTLTFPNGEPFEFEATSLHFGFNFHF